MKKILIGSVVSSLLVVGVAFAAVPTLKQTFQQEREAAKQELSQKKAEFQTAVQGIREKMQSEIKAKETELKTQVKKIKDIAKQQAVQKMYANLNDMNKRMTDQFVKSLNQLADVLDKIKSRTAKAQAAGTGGTGGIDIKTVQTAIANAENAIALARTAVQSQAGKAYSITVQSDTSAKLDVSKVRDNLKKDLKIAQDAVKSAREAVHTAATTLGKIQRVDEAKTPENETPKPTNTTTTTL